MADVQPADGIFLWHDAIYGGQCHGEPTGGKEGDGEGEAAFGDGLGGIFGDWKIYHCFLIICQKF